MITTTANRVTQNIRSPFDLTKPTMPRAFNVLEGTNRGDILVDDLTYSAMAVVRESTYGTLYFVGRMNVSLLESLVQQFRQMGEVGIGCWLEDPINDMIASDPDYDGWTLYFTERRRTTDETQYSLPNGYEIALRDRTLLKQSFDYESTLAAFGTEKNILQHTFGVVILHRGKMVCEAATGAPTHGRIEVGVTTDEEHRQHGLATIACARLIGMCEAQGYATWRDCAKQNIPSIKLARKLGYHEEREYRYVCWGKLL